MTIFDVWLGRFPSRDAYVAYFEENFSGEDDTPINKFAEDQGVTFFDHDWMEEYYQQSEDLVALITPAAYSKDYIDLVIRDAGARNIGSANTFIIIENDQIPDPRSVRRKDYELWYMGEYNCNT